MPNQPHRGGRSPSNGEARKERIPSTMWGTPRKRGDGEVGNKKENLPQGEARWRKREEAIDRGGGGAQADTRAPASTG